MRKIAVLLAVYNGREWIDEQINSILDQEGVVLDIYISVDLSTDNSYEYITQKYGYLNNIILLPYGMKYGSAGKNFYRLITDSPIEKYDYISFADQDDIWLKNKLAHAIQSIDLHKVTAYSSNVVAFWDDGRHCLLDKAQPQVKFDYIFEAAGPGCTYVFNRELAVKFQTFLTEKSNARNVALHDWLIYAFARSNGYLWMIDKESRMMYRQHSQNQVGANISFRAAFKRCALAKEGWYKNEIYNITSVLGFDNMELIKKLKNKNIIGRILLLKDICKFRRRQRDRFVLAAFILLGWV